MSAVRSEKRAPVFVTYTEVDVDVEPEDLERAGWVYVGKGNAAPLDAITTTERLLIAVESWHNDEHDGPFRWCAHGLCDQLRTNEREIP